MYFYYHPESESLFAEEDPIDVSSPFATYEEISEVDFYRIGKEKDLLFWVSQSKVKLFRRCHRAYHYKYILKLIKRLKAHPLLMGIVIHEAIELMLQGKSWKKPLRNAEKEIDKMFDEEAIDYQDLVSTSKGMIQGYEEMYEEDGLTPIEVELHIQVPLIDNIVLQGKVDSLQEEEGNGRLWQVEHKTCKSIPDEKNRMSDIQTLIYHWALPRIGMQAPIGVIWDYLRKKLPTVPQLLKKEGAGLSKAKNIDTTRAVYEQAIIDNDLDPDDYTEVLESLNGREENFFRRIKMPIAQSAVDSVVEDLKSTAIQMKEMGHIVKDRNMTRDCSWCDYYPICQSELRGGDVEQLISRQYTTKEQRDEKESKGKKRKVKGKAKG